MNQRNTFDNCVFDHTSNSHQLLIKLLQTISIATEKQNVGVDVELKYGHRGVGGTDFHFTVTDCLIPDNNVSESVTVPTVIQSEVELEEVKDKLTYVAEFVGDLVRNSIERQKLLDRRKELLSSLSEEDKYILGLV